METESMSDRSNDHGEEDKESSSQDSDFQQLSQDTDPGLIREFIDFLKYNKKWWLIPIMVVMLLLASIALLLPSPVAPFIYTLF